MTGNRAGTDDPRLALVADSNARGVDRVSAAEELIEAGSTEVVPLIEAWFAELNRSMVGDAYWLLLGRLCESRHVERAIAAAAERNAHPFPVLADAEREECEDEEDFKSGVAVNAAHALAIYVFRTKREREKILRALVRALLEARRRGESSFELKRYYETCLIVLEDRVLHYLPKWTPEQIDWDRLRPYLPDDPELLKGIVL